MGNCVQSAGCLQPNQAMSPNVVPHKQQIVNVQTSNVDVNKNRIKLKPLNNPNKELKTQNKSLVHKKQNSVNKQKAKQLFSQKKSLIKKQSQISTEELFQQLSSHQKLSKSGYQGIEIKAAILKKKSPKFLDYNQEQVQSKIKKNVQKPKDNFQKKTILKQFKIDQLKHNFKKTKQDNQLTQDTLKSLKQLILTKPVLNSILSKSFFEKVGDYRCETYWSHEQLMQLFRHFLKYANKCISAQGKVLAQNDDAVVFESEITSFVEQFGTDLKRLFREVTKKNSHLLKGLEYSSSFSKEKFTFDDKQLLEKLVRLTIGSSFDRKVTFLYLSSYLVKCCQQLEKAQTPVKNINERLVKFIEIILASVKQKYDRELHLYSSFKDKNASPTKTVDEHKQEACAKIVITLKGESGSKKNQQIEKLIQEMSRQSQNQEMRFIELVSESCLDNKGFCFEVEFHHKQQHSQTAMAMRKERLLRDDLGNNTKIEIPSNSVNISEQIVNELKQAEQAIQFVLKDKQEVTLDQLYTIEASCSFFSEESLKNAAQALINKISETTTKETSVQMISTSSVEECSGSSKIGGRVVKFKISEVCCSIRLSLRAFEPYNETFRQLKQITSCKLFSPLATLYDWNQELCKYFFGSVDKIIKNKNINNTTGEMEVYSKLQKQLKNFLSYKQETTDRTSITANQHPQLEKLKQLVESTQVSRTEAPEKVILRSARCFNVLGRHAYALQQLMRIDMNKQEEVACNLEISQTYLRLEYYNRAAIGFEKHVKYVQEKRLEQTDKRYLQSCLNLGVSLLNAGKYKRSEQVLEQLLKLQTAQFGENSVECVSTTIYIAKALQQQYKNKQALVKCESALNILRKIPNKSFSDDIRYSCLIAMMYGKLGKNADSEKILSNIFALLYQFALHDQQKAVQYFLLVANVYSSLGYYNQAKQYFVVASNIVQTLFGQKSMQYREILVQFGVFCLQQLQINFALFAFDLSQKIQRKVQGQNWMKHAQIQFFIALVYGTIDDQQEFEKYLKQSIQTYISINETDHPAYLFLLKQASKFYLDSRNFSKAKQLIKQYSKIVKSLYEPKSVQNADLSLMIAQTLLQSEILDEKEDLFQSVIKMYEELQVEDQLVYARVYTQMILWSIKKGNQSKAEQYCTKVIEIEKSQSSRKVDQMKVMGIMSQISGKILGSQKSKQINGQQRRVASYQKIIEFFKNNIKQKQPILFERAQTK